MVREMENSDGGENWRSLLWLVSGQGETRRGHVEACQIKNYNTTDDEAELTQIWEVEWYKALCLERTSESAYFTRRIRLYIPPSLASAQEAATAATRPHMMPTFSSPPLPPMPTHRCKSQNCSAADQKKTGNAPNADSNALLC